MTSLVTTSDSDEESVDSGEDSDTWNWRNAENNRLIIQLYKYDKEQDKRLDKLEQRLNGILALLGINEVPSDDAKEKALILVANGWNITINGGLS